MLFNCNLLKYTPLIRSYKNKKMVRGKSTVSSSAAPAEKTPAKAAPSVKKAASKKSEGVAAAVAPVVVSVPVVVETLVAEDAVESCDKSSLSSSLLSEVEEFNKNFAVWQATASSMKQNIRNISKLSARLSKNAEKTTKRRKNPQGNKLSGFEKPTLISDELALFFGRDTGSLMARTEVSKLIHQYVQAHNLQNKENRRIIHPDVKLKKLLDSKDDQLTYFNLQRYLKHHFKKEVPAASA